MLDRENFCDTEFWNSSLFWYTEHPQISPCFRDTILVWLPAIIIWSTSFLQVLSLIKSSKKNRHIPWNNINATRLTFTICLALLKLVECINYTIIALTPKQPDQNDPPALVMSAFIAPFIQLSCFALLSVLYHHHRKCGLHTNGLVWFFLFTSVLCGLPDFYATIVDIRAAISTTIEYVVKFAYYPILCALFLIDCIGDYAVPQPYTADTRPICPQVSASFCSSITFGWFNSFLMDGYRRPVTLSTLWQTQLKHRAQFLAPRFEKTWVSSYLSRKKTYVSVSGAQTYHNHISYVVMKLFYPQFIAAGSLKLVQDILAYTTPMILKQLLIYMNTPEEPLWHGLLWGILLLVVPTIQSVVLGAYFQRMQVLGLQIRSMLVGAIYRKAMVLGSGSRQQSTTGEIVNLMAVDSQRFLDLMMYVNLLWSAPLQIVVAISLIYQELGWAVFGGVACMMLVVPCNTFLANRIKRTQVLLMTTKDQRIKQMNEILSGIKVLKLYAWENSFIKNVTQYRRKELQYLKRILILDAFTVFGWSCSPFLVAVVSFAVFVSVDSNHVLDAEKAFVSIALFNLLRFPLTMLPQMITTLVMTLVSIGRLNRFLNNNELMRYVTRDDVAQALTINGASMSWDLGDRTNPPQAVLKDINMSVVKGEFVALVGQVASGKSSLLASIIGEMHRIKGRFNVAPGLTIAYVPQQAWIQNMTVRDNILFGREYNEKKYRMVLEACSLNADLATLPGGDQSEIGEKGINLSGGQKQRVSLARACYSEADIYLLDDPLSAVDSHVAKHLYHSILSPTTGLLKHATRILATNNLFVLPYTDRIEVMKEGRIIESGKYETLLNTRMGYFSEFMRQFSKTSDTPTEEPCVDEAPSSRPESEEPDSDGESHLTQEPHSIENSRQPTGKDEASANGRSRVPAILAIPDIHSMRVEDSKSPLSTSTASKIQMSVDAGKLIGIERAETGKVKFGIYLHYFKSASVLWLSAVVLSLTISSGFNVATNLWLSLWSEDASDILRSKDLNLRTKRMVVYALMGAMQCITVLIASVALAAGAIKAATSLHYTLLDRVLHSPMGFFDTTPIGRVVNRFAKDIDVVDSTLPGGFRSWTTCLLQVFSTIFIICFSFPTFLIILCPMAIVYYLIQKVFIVTTRQLKRLESINRSPMYSHFSETLSGISVIRAYDCDRRFIDQNNCLVDRNQSCCYPNVIANRWLSLRLEAFGNIITAATALFSVYYRESVGAGIAGLTISYALNITQTLSWLVRMTSDLETNIVSVERIIEYINNKIEDAWYKETRPPENWPTDGVIEFKNYSTRYREDTDIVLKDLTMTIGAKEKVGIVGRTGSGKSSLSLSIFRILEACEGGKIIIDGVDTSVIGLHDLRSKLTIIPQDPVLFSGNLRFNLDPLELYSDEELWRALEMAHLKSHIVQMQGGLQAKVSEYGENFSVGQRQLICLARAILRKSKVLVLDEATAAVDLETDSLVLETIRKEFSDCTVITIAHRLHTILDSDRVLVLEGGQIREFDTPRALLTNKRSIFAKMVEAANIKAD